MARQLDATERFELETLIDNHGINAVLSAIATICNEKEEHVATNWQDTILAKAWRTNARTVEKAAICSIDIP